MADWLSMGTYISRYWSYTRQSTWFKSSVPQSCILPEAVFLWNDCTVSPHYRWQLRDSGVLPALTDTEYELPWLKPRHFLFILGKILKLNLSSCWEEGRIELSLSCCWDVNTIWKNWHSTKIRFRNRIINLKNVNVKKKCCAFPLTNWLILTLVLSFPWVGGFGT